jgi:hypothetical protein
MTNFFVRIIKNIAILLAIYKFGYFLVTCLDIQNLLISLAVVNIKTKNELTENSLRNNLDKFFERKLLKSLKKDEPFKIGIKVLFPDISELENQTNNYYPLTPILYVKNNSNDILLIKKEAIQELSKIINLIGKILFNELIIEWNVVDLKTFNKNKHNNPWIKEIYEVSNFHFPLTVNYGKYAHNSIVLENGKYFYSELFGFKDADKMEFSVIVLANNVDILVCLLKFVIDNGTNKSAKTYIEFSDVFNKATG